MLDLHDSRSGLTYRWNESHTVNIYNAEGVEVDAFQFGFRADDTKPTYADFCAAVVRRIKEYV